MSTSILARSSCRLARFATVSLNPNRNITISSFNRESFKIQDAKDFDAKVKNSKVPVIVDFFATWCNPCRMLTPRLEAVIAENEGKINLAKVDIDENTDLALDYEVGSVPVLLAMRNGKVEERLIGLQDADKLRKWIQQVIVRDGQAKN